ncbi:MAG: alpha/beta fold hydrolase [Gemmatimonadaceae bacterium]
MKRGRSGFFRASGNLHIVRARGFRITTRHLPSPIPAPRSSGYLGPPAASLYWAAYGPPGVPRLLLLHGGPGAHHDYLLPQMLDLATDFELIFYDQRGGGRSKVADRTPITWRTHVDDLSLVVSELGGAEPSLVGYSWGGLLALLYAVEVESVSVQTAPPSRMVLIDPAPVTGAYRRQFEQEFNRRQNGAEIQKLRAELDSSGLRARDPEAHRQRLFELSVAGYFADPRLARDLTPFRVTGRVQQSVWESLGDYDLPKRLTGVRCPTLILHGIDDPIPVESSRAAAAAIPDARLVLLEASGHVPYVEAREPLLREIRQFLHETGRYRLQPT